MQSRILLENQTKLCLKKTELCLLTNTNLLTIGRHYTLTGSGAFLRFEASEAQHIDTANSEMHHQREKALDIQGLSANI